MLFLTTAIRTVMALFVGGLVVLSYTSEATARVGQEGSGVGRAALCAMVVVFTLWATSLYRRAGLRRPWCFIIAFLLSMLTSGSAIVTDEDPMAGIGAGFTLLFASYVILAIETAWLLRRARRRSRPRPVSRA
ncbi:hypothetical protein [Actinomyces sp.]|uniref:hypothetical protein n=1 Tax=Actinomyces sp. TaxID=29317 RepID=UPI0026DADDF2|nr:hypothetical protein [Actinomyces sp.]MDO4899459.1 hypothetical protein [Actinomyces sp.]